VDQLPLAQIVQIHQCPSEIARPGFRSRNCVDGKPAQREPCYLSVICSCCALKEKSTRESTDGTWEVEQPASEWSISLIRSEERQKDVKREMIQEASRLSRLLQNLYSRKVYVRGNFNLTRQGWKTRLFLFIHVVSPEKLSTCVLNNTCFSCHCR